MVGRRCVALRLHRDFADGEGLGDAGFGEEAQEADAGALAEGTDTRLLRDGSRARPVIIASEGFGANRQIHSRNRLTRTGTVVPISSKTATGLEASFSAFFMAILVLGKYRRLKSVARTFFFWRTNVLNSLLA